MKARLFVPAPLATISGGYNYDRRMLAQLPEMDVAELTGDPAEAWAALPADRVGVIDGLALPSFDGLDLSRAVGLIHHPTALETGAPETVQDIERRLLPMLRRVIVTSEATRDTLTTEFGVQPGRISVVTPGTDETPRAAGSGGPGCTILSVGTLIPRKGHDMLIRCVARLFDLDWRLVIVGDGRRNPAHAHTLQALAEELGVAQRVSFVGEASDADLTALWHTADVFALATRWEGYGMAVAEALAHGLPVAVTAGGAAAALVTAASGVTTAPDDEVQFAKALRRLVFDVELRRDMADAALAVGRTLPRWDAQAGLFAAALREE